MAPRTPRSPSQGSITLKDVTVDFTQEEWVLLDHSQQGLYLEVMLENVQNLHSVGLLVPREKFISCFQQRETPCLLEQECPRSPYPGAKSNFEVKEMFEKLRHCVEVYGPQRFMTEVSCDFILREICDSNMKIRWSIIFNEQMRKEKPRDRDREKEWKRPSLPQGAVSWKLIPSPC
ncbi:zinc finger protein 90 homolog isoform X9 [Monodelphis domestica]|uniref:zinc finger protein 90 homolog isoform X9 n=1 Tax=Monodelphis domestica TaxID=13616 RepID=UPI0024E1BB15|nr:zinc finger protein 90 homolog isoform X9 [Monodelphis domestica]